MNIRKRECLIWSLFAETTVGKPLISCQLAVQRKQSNRYSYSYALFQRAHSFVCWMIFTFVKLHGNYSLSVTQVNKFTWIEKYFGYFMFCNDFECYSNIVVMEQCVCVSFTIFHVIESIVGTRMLWMYANFLLHMKWNTKYIHPKTLK